LANINQVPYPPLNNNYPINSLPTPSQTNTQILSSEQIQRGFNVAGEFLKNDMLNAAIQNAKNKHSLSKLENCSHNVSSTLQTGTREEYTSIYQCRLKGIIIG